MQGNPGREFRWPIRIYYEDTDAGGIVYHANYLRFMERARTEWLRCLGHEQDELAANERIFFVVSSLTIDYISPARFNDEVAVVSCVRRCGRASIEFGQDIVRARQVLTRAVVRVGCIDADRLRPRAMPETLFTEIMHVAR